MTNISDIIDQSPVQCRALIIALIVGITSLATVNVFLYTSKENSISRERKLCEVLLNKKDSIIQKERDNYTGVIDSIINNQRLFYNRVRNRR